jgi:pectinesterase
MFIKSLAGSLMCFGCSVTLVFSQNTAGLTYQPDTSFTKTKAVKSVLGLYPSAKWAIAKENIDVEIKQDLTYTTESGLALKLDVFSPRSTQNSICLIMVHGGGWRTGDKDHHHEMAKELANRGYVVITPAYRLSTHALYPAAVVDIKTAVRWARFHAKELRIDTNKIAMAGFSAGGQLAALVGSSQEETLYDQSQTLKSISSKVVAVIDIDGILAFIHPESGEGDDSKSTSAATHWFGYSKTENPTLWHEGSALSHVSKSTPPTLFINSLQERMHAGREDYIKTLTQFGIYSEVHTFKAPHTFCMLEEWFIPTINLMDSFLKKTIPK